jgi:hypothetical protein
MLRTYCRYASTLVNLHAYGRLKVLFEGILPE